MRTKNKRKYIGPDVAVIYHGAPGQVGRFGYLRKGQRVVVNAEEWAFIQKNSPEEFTKSDGTEETLPPITEEEALRVESEQLKGVQETVDLPTEGPLALPWHEITADGFSARSRDSLIEIATELAKVDSNFSFKARASKGELIEAILSHVAKLGWDVLAPTIPEIMENSEAEVEAEEITEETEEENGEAH